MITFTVHYDLVIMVQMAEQRNNIVLACLFTIMRIWNVQMKYIICFTVRSTLTKC